MSRKRFQQKSRGASEGRGQERSNERGGARLEKRPQGDHKILKLKATVDKNRKGFGFLSFDKKEFEDAFIPPREAETLFHRDRVEVWVGSRGDVINIRVLERRFRELVGRFSVHHSKSGKSGWVVYERKSAREEVFIPSLPEGGTEPRDGDWIRAKLQFHLKGPFRVTGEIVEVFGQELPASADLPMVAAEYNLVEEHPEKAIQEAQAHRLEIPGRDLEGREDLRKMAFITIDGITARDFDDAVFVERKKSGHTLWVAIADVSHYVTPGSGLDTEAKSRGTSVYFPERAFHMLPHELSTGLCSLRPDEPRLAMVAKMEFDRAGNRLGTELLEAVIESKRRATYEQIQEERVKQSSNSAWEFSAHFELYESLKKARSQRGSIDFDLPEAEVRVDEKGEPISIENRERLDSHRLIEEFMIAANEAVTVWMMERSWPFVYRTHGEPAESALKKFETLARTVGIPVSLKKGQVTPKILSEIVKRVEGHPAQDLLNMSLLRAMKQAVYSAEHGIHYGLASEAYTHFTSPIRRYPDLVVHRLLRRALRAERQKEQSLKHGEHESLQRELEDVCEHCSYRERLAAEADREATRLKQVRLMHRHLGDEFDGKIIGMAESGLFVQLSKPYVEGMIPRDSLGDDFYQFNEEQMIFSGRRKKRTFRVGDRVKVRVVRADMDRRQIDFDLLDGPLARPEKFEDKSKRARTGRQI